MKRKYLYLLFCLLYGHIAMADYFEYNAEYAIPSFIYDDILITKFGEVSSNTTSPITIQRQAMNIVNHGIISSDVDINGYDIYITNTGNVNGRFLNNNNGSITQNITNTSELTSLDVIGGNFNVAVSDFNNVSFDDIQMLNANNFTFERTSVIINDFKDWNNFSKNISFVGNENKIYITNSYTVDSGTYIKFLDGTSNISVIVTDSDKLHKASLDRKLTGIILNIVRETDYSKIFEDKRGELLNDLRASSPNDKLLAKMDRANNLNELHHVMNSSYRFNPVILTRPMNILNNFYMMDMLNDEEKETVGIEPFYVGGDNISSYGLRAYFANKYFDRFFNFGVHFNNFDYKDNINNFSGIEYGLDIKAKTNVYDKYWARAISGINIMQFKADYIYHDNDIKKNPFGFSWYGNADVGYDYDVDQDLVLSPFAGLGIQTNKVLSEFDTDVKLRVGSDIKYNFETDGIKYEYGATVAVDTDGDLSAKIKAGFLSMLDQTGASVDIDIFNDSDYGFNYKLSVNAKTMF